MASKRKPRTAPARVKADKAKAEDARAADAGESILFHDRASSLRRAHTPIIVTDGSASLEFNESHYRPSTANPHRRESTDLHLVKISAHRAHSSADNPESRGRVCVPLVAGELYEIVVTCERGGRPPRNFVIGGGPTFSPVIEFEHGLGAEYQRDPANFPPIDLGARYGNLNRNITRLEIFRIENTSRVRIHDCQVVEPDCEYRILDIH